MSLSIRGYEVVIGIETHAQLSTRSKIFSGSPTAFGAAPNTQASAVDLALPGTLPVLNRGAVERAIRFGMAVGGKVAELSIFARKNYFYPDLPKGYQISQYETPVVQGGAVSFFVGGEPRRIALTRAHLEEDAGKSLHEDYQGRTGIDLNRAGTPLLEIVSEPDMRSSAEAVEYAKELHKLVVWLDICDGNMQEGSFRCDANVSVRRPGAPFGTRREIKNLNSFKFMQQAIDYEVQWQIDLIEDGGEVRQATVLFDPDRGETRAMRTKEDAHDYRYFPDPDLPPLVIEPAWIERIRAAQPELPLEAAERLRDACSYSTDEAAFATRDRATRDYVSALNAALVLRDVAALRERLGKRDERRYPAGLSLDEVVQRELYRLGIAWVMNEVARRLNAVDAGFEAVRVAPPTLADLLLRIGRGELSSSGAKQVFDALWAGEPADIDALIASKGLAPMNDAVALERIVADVIAANPKSVDEFRGGKEKALNALVGQAMKASRGKADPEQLTALLRRTLA
jgi:aspartyl-tRNA(Asn)/glutamyl-tRNA(Gln) amidotransferase subunit B